jgi:cytoskeleton protein RodZ
MQTIGERLEEARKKKGISIREAAEATKIRGDYLSKFENNQFDISLTELYVRGFLRTYANFLRLPADRIINDYAALGRGEARPRQPSREIYGRMDVSIASADEHGDKTTVMPEEPTPAPQPARRTSGAGRRVGSASSTGIDPALIFKFGKWAGIALAAVLLVWVVKAIFSSAATDHVSKPATAAAPVATSAPASEPTITLIALDTVRVAVKAVSDGRVLLPDTTLVRGQTQIVPKPGPIYITYTAGKNLEVDVNGKRYPMPTEGYDRAQIR